MRNLFKLIIYLILIGLCLKSYGQSNKNHSFGFQLNPYIDHGLLNGYSITQVYAIRYSFFNLKDHLQFGPEISGCYVKARINNSWVSKTNIGAYARINILSKARFIPFFEFSPNCSFFSYKTDPNQVQNIPWPGSGNDIYFSCYISPGLSLYTKSRKLSLDLLFKYSIINKWLVNGRFVPSYRININF